MWLFSTTSEAFGGKTLWLRPGSVHVFGRTSAAAQPGEQNHHINNKTVSRKHLILSIAATQPGDSGRVSNANSITVTDNSKVGSYVNDELVKGGDLTLDGSKRVYTIKLGRVYQESFKLEWRPVVLTGKAFKKGQKKEELEQAGVKTVLNYVTNETTHVVATKRNTLSGLQALVQARWVVSESFIDALADACKKGLDGACSLEDDFDQSWPNETDHITPSGSEPVPRGDELMRPDPERSNVFKNYSFVFLFSDQYEQLLPIITGGGGKALLHQCDAGSSAAADVVKFAKELAGKKDARNFTLSQVPGPGGIVLVRPGENTAGRNPKLLDHIQVSLNQRMIEQSELLDAILTKDGSSFRQALPDPPESLIEVNMQDAPPSTSDIRHMAGASSSMPRHSLSRPATEAADPTPAVSHHISHPPADEERTIESEQPREQQAEQPTGRRRRRIITTQPRAKFGDDYDPSQITRTESKSPEPSQARQNGSGAQDVEIMDVGDISSQTNNTQRNSRKRAAPVETIDEEEEEETEEQRRDRLYPAQAAMKRRKTQAEKNGGSSAVRPSPGVESASASASSESKAKKGKKKVIDSDADIKAKLKARREEEEAKADEARRLDEEAAEEMKTWDPTQKLDYEALGMIKSFEVLNLPQVQQNQTEARADHPEWNGRPNFKKFRSNKIRNRDPNNPRNASQDTQSVLVSLEEVPRKEHGLGDSYWLETGHEKRRKNQNKSQQSESQTQTSGSRSQSQAGRLSSRRQAAAGDDEDSEDDIHAFRRRVHRSGEDDAANADGDERVQVVRSTAGSTQTLRGDPSPAQRNVIGKRPASTLGASAAPPAKKARHGTLAGGRRGPLGRDVSDDDEDPTAFRRKRR